MPEIRVGLGESVVGATRFWVRDGDYDVAACVQHADEQRQLGRRVTSTGFEKVDRIGCWYCVPAAEGATAPC